MLGELPVYAAGVMDGGWDVRVVIGGNFGMVRALLGKEETLGLSVITHRLHQSKCCPGRVFPRTEESPWLLVDVIRA